MGEMTASFAHELNQPLTAIANNASAARRFLERGNIDVELLRELLQSMKENSLGTLGNSIAGIVGGGLGGTILQSIIGGAATGGGSLDLTTILSNVAGGGVGGAILMSFSSLRWRSCGARLNNDISRPLLPSRHLNTS